MANLIYRESTTATIPSTTSLKGSPLSNLEIDGNFRSINSHLSTHDTNISSITYDLSVISNNIASINTNKPSNTGIGATGTWAINISGNSASVTNGVYTTGSQTIAGIKSFSSTINGNISGNAETVTNGVYTSGDQTISGIKTFNNIVNCNISGNAGTVTNGVYTSGDQTISGIKTFSNINSTNITSNTIKIGDASWVVKQTGTSIIFSYGGIDKMRLDSSGNLTVVGNITAYGIL